MQSYSRRSFTQVLQDRYDKLDARRRAAKAQGDTATAADCKIRLDEIELLAQAGGLAVITETSLFDAHNEALRNAASCEGVVKLA